MFSSIQGKYVRGLMKEIVNKTLDDVSIKRLLKAHCGIVDIPSLTSISYSKIHVNLREARVKGFEALNR